MPYVNKITAGEDEIDLTGDTLVSTDQLAEGVIAHAASGEQIVGTLSTSGGGGVLSKWIYVGQAAYGSSVNIASVYSQAEEFMVYFVKNTGATPLRIPIHIVKSSLANGNNYAGGYYYDSQYNVCAVVRMSSSSVVINSDWAVAKEAGSNVLSSCKIEVYYRTASGVSVTQDDSTKALEIS